jgi:hypothetical protein
VSRVPWIVGALLAIALLPGCLTYERSQTRVAIDRKTGTARVQVTYWNLASTETGRSRQREDLEQLDSLRRSDAYFTNSFLHGSGRGKVSRRRVWIERGKVNASYTITTRDLNQLAEGWTADSAGYRFSSNLQIANTNGARTDDEKPTVKWRRSATLLLVTERDPHFSEAVPFLPEIRESLAARLHPPGKPAKRTAKHSSKRSARGNTAR